jgi:hypothetical protein
MSFCLLALVLLATPEPAPDTVVVCPREFLGALGPWLEYRASQGHRVERVSNLGTPQEIRTAIRAAAKGGKLRFVVLVGDADPAMRLDARIRARCVPTHHAAAKVNVHWGSEPEIAADNWYADMDDDQIPDVAIGRLTADSPAELSRMVRNILAYEQAASHGLWRRRINFVAGVGGFGALADAALESATKTILTRHVPIPFETSMTYASWRSPYCPNPRGFHQAAVERWNEGCLFWVYIGHGSRQAVDQARMPDGEFHILGCGDMPRLRPAAGAPIALFLSCYSGEFDGGDDCLAEEMLRTEGGPVGVMCGTRVTMPYGLSSLGTELIAAFFQQRQVTTGEALLAAKRNTMLRKRDDEQTQQLDGLAELLSPTETTLAEERNEHVQLFHLLGDPLLRVQHPGAVEVQTAKTATAGSSLEITGVSSIDGQATVELIVRRDRLTFKPPRRTQYASTPEARDEYQEIYRRANDLRLASQTVAVVGGKFQTKLAIPESAAGECHVRVFVQGAQGHALGSCDVKVESRK